MKSENVEINEEILNKINEMDRSSEAYKALSIISKIVDAIGNGTQLDPSFVFKIKEELEKKIDTESKEKRVIKKKKRNIR